jgi:adhesin transport system outer membrane protein
MMRKRFSKKCPIYLLSILAALIIFVPYSFAQDVTAAQAKSIASLNTLKMRLLHNKGGFPVSLNTIILFALENNPQIEALEYRKDQAEHAIREKWSEYLPQVSARAEFGREYNEPGGGNVAPGSGKTNNAANLTLTLEQVIFNGFRTYNEIKQREHLRESTTYQRDQAIEFVINDTVDNYLKAIRLQEDIKVIAALLVDIQGTLQTIDELFEAGESGKVMLDYARSREAFATTELNKALSRLSDAQSNIEFMTGKLPDDFIAVPPEELLPDKLDMQFYLETIETRNSNVLAKLHDRQTIERLLKQEKARYYPKVTFNLDAEDKHNDGGPLGRQTEVSGTFRVSYDIFDGGERNAAVNRTKSQIKELEQTRQQAIKEAKRDIKLAYNQVQASKDAIELTEIEIESNIAQKVLNEQNFELGNINVIELIESAERLKDAYTKKNELIYEMYKNSYELLVTTKVIEQKYFCETCLLGHGNSDL